jgi:hypothetical protein
MVTEELYDNQAPPPAFLPADHVLIYGSGQRGTGQDASSSTNSNIASLPYLADENIAVINGKPVFVQFVIVNGITKIKKATTQIDGAIRASVLKDATQYVQFPARTILPNTPNVVAGRRYSYSLSTGSIVPFSTGPNLLYIGQGVDNGKLRFEDHFFGCDGTIVPPPTDNCVLTITNITATPSTPICTLSINSITSTIITTSGPMITGWQDVQLQ